MIDYRKIKPGIPHISGVYIFKGERNQTLYVGKASNLANRIRSYFSGAKTPVIKKMLEEAKTLTWQETISDIEALILESTLIKKYKPPFNTVMRDDKQYFYIGFTKEKFPRIFLTHQPQNQTIKVNVVGPFTNGEALKTTLKSLRKIFPYCTCKQKHNRYCLNYHIGNCLGYCCLKNSSKNQVVEKEYKTNIQSVKDILSGKKKSLLQKMFRQLTDSLDQKDHIKINEKIIKLKRVFENATILRSLQHDKKNLVQLKNLLNLPSIPVRIEGYDISNIQGLFATGSMVAFTNGRPDKNEYRKFKIKTIIGSNDTAMLQEVLSRRLLHKEWVYPDLIVVDGSKGQVNAVRDVVEKMESHIPVIGLVKNSLHKGQSVLLQDNKKADLDSLPSPIKNLLLNIDAEAHRFAINYYRKRHRL